MFKKTVKNYTALTAIIFSFISLTFLLIQSVSYSKLNITIYASLFFILYLLVIGSAILIIEGNILKRKLLWIGGYILMSILLVMSLFGNYYLIRINASINQVIVDRNQQTTVETAFASYQHNDWTSVEDLNNAKFGVLSNTDENDRNAYVKNEIIDLGLNVSYVEYISYNEMLLGLFNNDIDIAVLPADYQKQYGDYEGYNTFLEETNTVYTFNYTYEVINESSDLDVTKDPFTILVFGTDGGRSDSMILTTFNPVTLSITMTSIARDSYVPIACYPNQEKDKLGHAYAVSKECAVDTVSNLFGIDIDYYLTVNFQGVVDIVDALDKVWLTSPVEFVGQNSDDQRGTYTVWVPEGGFWATGEQALALARERYHMPNGDYTRQVNQQAVIQSIIQRTLELKDINRAIEVLDAAGANVQTNMPLSQMIDIFNLLLRTMNKTGLTTDSILLTTGSRVLGYSDYFYNEELQLPLWIMKPYEGSIADLRSLMESNLAQPTNITDELSVQFNASLVLYREDYFSRTYDEKEIHEVLPDYMPTMSYNDWTLEKAREWASTRGITLSVEEIKSGNALYTSDVEHNYIVGQSVRYGIKTSNFSNLSLKVIKHDLDCNISDNMKYDECYYKLPDFTTTKTLISKVIDWANNYNVKLTYTVIPETDVRFDKSFIGYVYDQSPVEWTDVRNLDSLNLTIMDSNYSVIVPNMLTWTLEEAKSWVEENMYSKNNIVVTYVPTLDSILLNTVVKTVPIAESKIKVKENLAVQVYGEGYKLLDYKDKLKTVVDTDLCSTNILICNYIEVEIADQTKDGVIKSQNVVAGTIKLKTVWKDTIVTFEVYKYVAPTVTEPSTTP